MNVIDDIKQKLDIVDLIADYVPDLKKTGHNFKAICPFHSEKTGSFYIFPDHQTWHCFGACGTGGDVFSFIMRKEGVEFKDALHILARRIGIDIDLERRKGNEKGNLVNKLKQINRLAAEYYHNLLRLSPQARAAREYLATRGVSLEMIERFNLGYSLNSWDALRGEFIKRGYSEKDLISAGLLVAKEKGGSYDRFRNRIIFPISDNGGQVIGFGGRVLDGSLPKYLNSPQTPLFDKSSILYGIDLAKETIRKQDVAVIVEGFTDVIAAHQHGFTNVVASMGTALTEKHINVIKNLTKKLTLALDADTAGELATLRGIEVASRAFDHITVPVISTQGVTYQKCLNAEIKVIVLPPGKDPDNLIKESPTTWESLLVKALPVIDYTFNLVVLRADLHRWQDKSLVVDQLLPFIYEIKHPIKRALYIQKLSNIVAIDESILWSALEKIKPKKNNFGNKPTQSDLVPILAEGDPLADYWFAVLIRSKNIKLWDFARKIISADYFINTESRALFLAWNNSPDLDTLRQRIEGFLQEYLDILVKKTIPPMTRDSEYKAIAESTHRMKLRWLQTTIKNLDSSQDSSTWDLLIKQLRDAFKQGPFGSYK